MAQRVRSYEKYESYERYEYVYGNAAPKIDIKRQIEEAPVRRTSQTTKKNRARQHAWSPAYIVVLTVCMVLAGYMAAYHVKLNAIVTTQVKTINEMETKLNNMRRANDEEWCRVNNNIDMEEIKRIAIGELGMTYAKEGQIVTYTSEGADYMRKVVED